MEYHTESSHQNFKEVPQIPNKPISSQMQEGSRKHKSRAVQSLLEKFKDASPSDTKGEFKFPPPPPIHEPRLSPAIYSDSSDSQPEGGTRCKTNVKSISAKRDCRSESESEKLPPIGVFWDIENCQIPHGKSALTIVQTIRNTFFDDFREAEFTVVCDVHKESPLVIQELNDAQVDLLHVISRSKNAADEKLRQAIRRFADLHGSPSAVILLSSDINFAPDLSDLRHRKKIHVILLHSSQCSDSLIMCANEHYNFADFVQPLPSRHQQIESMSVDVFVWNLPTSQEDHRIRGRLKMLSQNCSGRIIVISGPMAVLRFPTLQMALRAQKRMDGENIFGQAIRVGVSHLMDPPMKVDSSNMNQSNEFESISCGYNGNNTFSHNGQYQSSFLPINPSPANGASQLWTGIQNKTVQPQLCTDLKENWPPTVCNNSLISWPAKNGAKNGITDGTQIVVNAMDKLVVSNGGAVCTSKSTNAKGFVHSAHDVQSSEPKSWSALFQDHTTDSSKKRSKNLLVNGSLRPASITRNSCESGWNSSRTVSDNRKCRTPSPYFFNSRKSLPIAVKPSSQNAANASLPSEGFDKDKYFSPIQSSNNGIELLVTNLDQMMDPTKIKKLLFNLFSEHIRVLNLIVFVRADKTFSARVRVSSLLDAQLAISRLHRRRVGSKKITISYAQNIHLNNLQYIKWQTVSLLQDVPQNSILLFKFLDIFEARYMTSLTASDMLKLKDVCTVTDIEGRRMVSLNAEYRDALSIPQPSVQEIQFFCSKHYTPHQTNGIGWAGQAPTLPNVMLPLTKFTTNIHKLLSTHNNVLPLASLYNCYEVDCEPLDIDDSGVPLEHYVTCVSHVELAVASNGIKYLRPCSPKNPPEVNIEEYPQSVSPSLVGIVTLFEREVVDLLKTQPHSRLLFNKFIPAYHHHFGRQCRVSDYGFVKLINLLEAIPNVVQVLGEGNQRSITLTHRSQIRRFTSELFRILKSQPMKNLSLFELPAIFERVLGRVFDPVDYGMCSLNDLVQYLSECSAITIEENLLSIPKSVQSADEIKLTKQFERQVVELLSHTPKNSFHFEKFIPAYHRLFNEQCKVSDFGFTKLIELFEAIPDTVKLDEDAEGRRISLTHFKRLEVLGNQIIDIIYPSFPQGIPLSYVNSRYLWHYGYTLNPSTYNTDSLEELLSQLDTVKVVDSEQGRIVVPLEGALLKQISSRVKAILINSDKGRMPLGKIRSHFSVYHEPYLSPMKLLDALPGVIQFDEEYSVVIVELTPLYQFVRQLVKLISDNEGRMPLNSIEEAYKKEYDIAANPSDFGFAAVEELLNETPSIFVVRGKGARRQVRLSKELTGSLSKPGNIVLLSGAAVRPPSSTDMSTSISDTSNAGSIGECTRESPTPLVASLELSSAAFNNGAASHVLKSDEVGQHQIATAPPDASALPSPLMLFNSKPENGKYNDDSHKSYGLFYGQSLFSPSVLPQQNLTSEYDHTHGASNKRKARLAAHFDLPLYPN